jgi:2-oxoacid:acceptor oxidoreductase delta subunit (pyruvate/2-ketoisovalerate family)
MRITMGAVVKGGTSVNYKTGDWRDNRPVLHMELCKSCGICDMVCPESAISVINGAYVIDYDYCKGCALCAHECPTKAIVIVAEEK